MKGAGLQAIHTVNDMHSSGQSQLRITKKNHSLALAVHYSTPEEDDQRAHQALKLKTCKLIHPPISTIENS
jgi:hypothetical protein